MLNPSKPSGYLTAENSEKSSSSTATCCFQLQGLPLKKVAPFTCEHDFLLLATELQPKLRRGSPGRAVCTTYHIRGDVASLHSLLKDLMFTTMTSSTL